MKAKLIRNQFLMGMKWVLIRSSQPDVLHEALQGCFLTHTISRKWRCGCCDRAQAADTPLCMLSPCYSCKTYTSPGQSIVKNKGFWVNSYPDYISKRQASLCCFQTATSRLKMSQGFSIPLTPGSVDCVVQSRSQIEEQHSQRINIRASG